MGRKVYVSGDMATDPRVLDVADENPEAALLWPWIIMALDDWGRAEADQRALKYSLFPGIATVTKSMIEDALQAYARHDLIVLYEAEGRRWMSVPPARWWRWQTHIHKDKRRDDSGSHCPAPPQPPPAAIEDRPAESRESPRDPAESRASLLFSSLHHTSLHHEHVPTAEAGRDEREPPGKPFEPDFDPLWEIYPRKAYRVKAFKAFQALMRRTDPPERAGLLDELAQATGHYAEAKASVEARYVMHGSTWFGPDEPWRDWIAGIPDDETPTSPNGHRPDPFDELAQRLEAHP